MDIVSDKQEIIFRKDYNGKPSYTLGLSKKDKDGQFIHGYIKVNFRKGVELENKTKIKVKDGWLDFYKDEDKTIPTIFINEYDVIEEPAKEVANGGKKEANPFEEFGQKFEHKEPDIHTTKRSIHNIK